MSRRKSSPSDRARRARRMGRHVERLDEQIDTTATARLDARAAKGGDVAMALDEKLNGRPGQPLEGLHAERRIARRKVYEAEIAPEGDSYAGTTTRNSAIFPMRGTR